jgi:glycyl-tRNA synthetase beta chain
MNYRDLLLEIGTEEIPTRFISPALSAVSEAAAEEFKAERLTFEKIQVLGTPRRIAIIVRSLALKQEDKTEEFRGPAWGSAFDASGTPAKAAKGFARSKGVEVEALEKRVVGEQEFAVAVVRQEGKDTREILPGLLGKVARSITFPKSMYWDSTFNRFARPVRWLLSIYGEEYVSVEFGTVRSDRFTRGHRFMGQKKIEIASVGEYLEKLHDNFVIADPGYRR